MKNHHIFKIGEYEVTATHYCGLYTYPIEGEHSTNMIRNIIPANIEHITDMDVLRNIHVKLMETMNVLWSSSHGVACFPEEFGIKTKFSHGEMGMIFSGDGWNITIYYRGYEYFRETNKNLLNECFEKVGGLVKTMPDYDARLEAISDWYLPKVFVTN